jgi:hypothetical protein
MSIFGKITLAFALATTAIGCGNSTKAPAISVNPKKYIVVSGDYVSDSYSKRNEGYDWVSATIKPLSDSTYHLSVRSRADSKRPTCTFDAEGVKLSADTLSTKFDGKEILFVFKDSILNITTAREEDKGLLNYFCSGGGSLEGAYYKLKEPLDKSQIDRRNFIQVLPYQSTGFEISTTGEGSLQQLTVLPYGLTKDNGKIVSEIEGSVTKAEIGDLNADGFPEILIFTTSAGSGSYGNVIGYSVNNGKSLSQISFPNITDNPKANKGFMGHDEFEIVENTLVQRFRIYNPNDTNNKPTGGYRQIQYKLREGESMRKFVIDKIVEFPASSDK